MVDIFDEVDEELRAEKAKNLLTRYGGAIFGACLLVVAGVAGWQGWNWWQARQLMQVATSYLDNLSKATGDGFVAQDARAAGIKGLEAIAQSGPDGYGTLSRLQVAAMKADGGDLAGAIQLWNQVSADRSADPELRDLASLLWATHQLDSAEAGLLQARLRPLIEPGNPWRALAREQLALLDLRLGRVEEAKAALRALAEDVTAPEGVRGRASIVLGKANG